MKLENIFTEQELAFIDSGNYKPGRAVLDAKLDLVAAVEREACAKLCETEMRDWYASQNKTAQSKIMLYTAVYDCAAAIRERGQT